MATREEARGSLGVEQAQWRRTITVWVLTFLNIATRFCIPGNGARNACWYFLCSCRIFRKRIEYCCSI